MDLLKQISRYVSQREALAEALLEAALFKQTMRDRFQKLAKLHGNAKLVEVRRQICSADGKARHDLILISQTGREYRMELKIGDGNFTERQKRALRKGPAASDQTRIDVLVLPRKMKLPAGTHPAIRLVTWEELDEHGVTTSPSIGRFCDLWSSPSYVAWSDVIKDARSYANYWKNHPADAEWHQALGASVNYLRERLASSPFEFGKIDGQRSAGPYSYYGTYVNQDAWWLGWVFAGGKRGLFKLVLMIEEIDRTCSPSYREQLPTWYDSEKYGVVLADYASNGEVGVDLEAAAEIVRKACK